MVEENRKFLISLGTLHLYVGSRSYDTSTIEKEFIWRESQTIGQRHDNFQYLGKKSDTVTLRGINYALRYGREALSFVDELDLEASRGEPLEVFNARGVSYGRWIVLRISAENRFFTIDGYSKRISYSITLKQWDGDRWTNT